MRKPPIYALGTSSSRNLLHGRVCLNNSLYGGKLLMLKFTRLLDNLIVPCVAAMGEEWTILDSIFDSLKDLLSWCRSVKKL